jgi:hypothetical protein
MEAYKIIYIDEQNNYGIFMFTARTKDEANETYNRLRYEHECYYPKIKKLFWKGTIEQWEEETKKRNQNEYWRRTNTSEAEHNLHIQQDDDAEEDGDE